jgi:predicted permease
MTDRRTRPPFVGRLLLRLSRLGDRRDDVCADMEELFTARVASLGRKEARRRFNADALSVWGQSGSGPRDPWVSGVGQDVRYAIRSLRRARTSSAVIVLTLTIGLSANAVMFGVVDQLLLRNPVGVGHPESVRFVYFGSEAPPAMTGGRSRVASKSSSYPVIDAVRRATEAGATGAVVFPATVTVGGGPDARQAALELVSANYFTLLEVAPFAGRLIDSGMNPGSPGSDVEPAAVLSHGFWMREWGARPDVVGRDIRVHGVNLTVVGVAPPGFIGAGQTPVDLWVPIGALGRSLAGDGWTTNFGRYGFSLISRVRPDASEAAVAAAATQAVRAAVADSGSPATDPLETAMLVRLAGRFAPDGMDADATVSVWLLGVAVIVLVISVANVAQVLLSRALARRREIATKLALGLGRRRLTRQLLIESTVLTLPAALVATGGALIASRLVQQVLLPGFVWRAETLDSRVMLVTLSLTGIAALGAGLAPAWYASGAAFGSGLRGAAQVVRGRHGRLRFALMVTQVALCAVLLAGAGLFIKSLRAAEHVDPGLDLDRVVVASLRGSPGTSVAATDDLYAAAVARLSRVPVVSRVAVTRGSAPLRATTPVSVRSDSSAEPRAGRPVPFYSAVNPGHFATLGTRLVSGRDFTEEENRLPTHVAVVSEALAQEHWPGADPIGRCITLGSDPLCTRVIGLVSNTMQLSRTSPDHPHVYIPVSHPSFGRGRPTALLIRVEGDVASALPLIRRELQALAPDLPWVNVEALENLAAPHLRQWRLGVTMFSIFGGAALLIAIVGLTGAIVHIVSERSHEIGVRMALGAAPLAVVAQVGGIVARTVVVGTLLGLTLAAASAGRLSEVLFETSPRDPWVFAMVAIVLVGVGLVAAVVPIRRATRVDPLIVLKAE